MKYQFSKFLVIFLLFFAVFAISGVSYAQNGNEAVATETINPALESLSSELENRITRLDQSISELETVRAFTEAGNQNNTDHLESLDTYSDNLKNLRYSLADIQTQANDGTLDPASIPASNDLISQVDRINSQIDNGISKVNRLVISREANAERIEAAAQTTLKNQIARQNSSTNTVLTQEELILELDEKLAELDQTNDNLMATRELTLAEDGVTLRDGINYTDYTVTLDEYTDRLDTLRSSLTATRTLATNGVLDSQAMTASNNQISQVSRLHSQINNSISQANRRIVSSQNNAERIATAKQRTQESQVARQATNTSSGGSNILSSITLSFKTIMANIVKSVQKTPQLFAVLAYLLGIGFGVKAILQLKSHVDNPSSVPLRTPIAHFLIGGGFFALPTIVSAMANSIDPNVSNFVSPTETASDIIGVIVGASTLSGLSSFNQIFANLVFAMSNTPLLIYALAYLSALVMTVMALLKLKDHIEDNSKAPLRAVVGRFLLGGALFSMPTIFTAAATAISPGYKAFGFVDIITNIVSNTGFYNATLAANTGDTNQIVTNFLGSTSGFPALISSLAFFLGLVIVISGVFKLKEHVDDERTPMKEGIIRLIVGGALIALPVIFIAMYTAITGASGIATLAGGGGAGLSCAANANNLGGVLCNLFNSTNSIPFFLTMLAYFAGTAVGLWAILQFQEHVLSPQQVKFWDPFSKMIVAGALFALPSIITVTKNTVTGGISDQAPSTFNDASAAGSTGLDGLISNLMLDVFDPMVFIIEWFGIVAGFILVFIGISRFLKSSQEGAKGPAGIGTIMTFIAGGALISFSPMVSSALATVFIDPTAKTYASLTYTAGMDAAAQVKANAVIAGIFRFVFLLGLISIMRGLFIVRGVSEGSSQASMMAGVTHLIGGALAVNLGGFIGVVQNTLGITAYGLTFP